MSPIHHAILRDLAVSQSTADSIAGRIGLSEPMTAANLRQLQGDGYVTTIPIQIAGKDALTVYRLTEKPVL